MKKMFLFLVLSILILFTACGNQQTGQIKGNINSKGEKIYHMPGGQYYNATKAEVYFNTEEEAKTAGFRKSLK